MLARAQLQRCVDEVLWLAIDTGSKAPKSCPSWYSASQRAPTVRFVNACHRVRSGVPASFYRSFRRRTGSPASKGTAPSIGTPELGEAFGLDLTERGMTRARRGQPSVSPGAPLTRVRHTVGAIRALLADSLTCEG